MKHTFSRRQLLGLAALAGTISHTRLPFAFAATSIWQELKDIRLPHEIGPELLTHGNLPEGLNGTYFKNGGAMPVGRSRLPQHRFDYDGFVQAFDFQNGEITYRARFVETRKLAAEREFGDLYLAGFDTMWPESPALQNLDEINPSNINIIAQGSQLLSLWEAGSAWQIDPETLQSIGPVAWRDDLEAMPFSAHPKHDEDGSLWNFGHMPWLKKTALYHIDAAGKLLNFNLLDMENTGMCHDFAITRSHLILMMPPLHWQHERADAATTFLGMHEWRQTDPVEIFVLDKNRLEVTRRYHIPANFHFHIAGAFENNDGTIEVTLCQYPNADILWQTLKIWGQPTPTALKAQIPKMRKLTLPAQSGTVTMAMEHHGHLEFPRLAGDFQKRRDSKCWSSGVDQASGLLRYIHATNLQTGASQTFDYGPDKFVDEHVFVPKPVGKQRYDEDGWLVGTHYNFKRHQTILSLLDASHVERGPIVTAALPMAVGPALHGNFVPR